MRDLANWPYPRVIAHRCGGALAPENTLAGLNVSAILGCQGAEFDVMLSADGIPFVIHDDTVDRTTSSSGKVCETRAGVLDQLDVGAKFHRAFTGEPIPRFAHIIAKCRELDFAANVEIKPSPGFEVATGEAAAHAAAAGWEGSSHVPLLSSFSEFALAAAAKAEPQLPLALLIDRVPADWQIRCQRLGVIALHTNCRYLDKVTACAIKVAGYRLAVYTQNDLEQALRMFGWGVDTVITDRPDLVRT